MKHFFDLTFPPFFVITGAGTALAALDAFWPRWALDTIQKITYVQDYTIFVRHWGIMWWAFSWLSRVSILVYSAIEKTFMVYPALINFSYPYSQGFWVPAAMDAVVVLYTIAYFATHGFETSGPPANALRIKI
jgi:hypothetical protein